MVWALFDPKRYHLKWNRLNYQLLFRKRACASRLYSRDQWISELKFRNKKVFYHKRNILWQLKIGVFSWTPQVIPQSLIYTPKRDDRHPQPFHVGVSASEWLSLLMSQVAHQAGAYPGVSGMKWLGVFLLPLDGLLVCHRVTPHYESKVSCPRTQYNVPG